MDNTDNNSLSNGDFTNNKYTIINPDDRSFQNYTIIDGNSIDIKSLEKKNISRHNNNSLDRIIYNKLKSNDCILSIDQQTNIYKIIKNANLVIEINKEFEDGLNNKKTTYIIIPKLVYKLYSIFKSNTEVVIAPNDMYDYIKFILICIVDSPLVSIGEFGKDIIEDVINHSIDLLKIQIPDIQEEIYEEIERCQFITRFKRMFCCFTKVKTNKSTIRLSNPVVTVTVT